MDVEDMENTISVSSAILNSTNSQQNEVLSEDLAWADSCLVKNADISETDWIPVREALLEIFSSQDQSFSGDEREDIEIRPHSEDKNVEKIQLALAQESSTSDAENLYGPSSTHNVIPLSMALETSTDEIPVTYQGNPFLPTYNEDLMQNETIDLGFNLDFSNYETEHASENIFKIWDLDIPSEEGELVKQLNKALSENSLQAGLSTFYDSRKWKDLKEDSIDDLVADIADLSLTKKV